MEKHELKIEGMNCGHCVMHVRRALEAVEGLEVDSVEVGSAHVVFDGAKIDRKVLGDAIEAAGYKLVSM
jgi:copper chaperone